jgi:hypothetical protein
VSAWLATVRVEVVKMAVPPLSVPVKMGLPPSVNVTVPVALAGITFAVKVTGFPLAAGLGEATSVVVVGDLVTVMPKEDELPA